MIMQDNEKKPALRFKGFTDPWEQRKLGDISEIKTGPFGSTLHADDYVSDGIPIITTEHFKTGSLPIDKCGLPQVSENDFSRLSAYILNAGDIVFSRVGSVDINALITPFQSTWLFSGRVLRVRPQNKNSSQFLHTLLETEDVKNDIRTRAVGQTMPSINTEILKTTPLRLPESTLEQEQLGKYFLNLDTLITLHQRKYEKLVNIKKSMLDKMFPKNGASVPEIRFKGFTDPWEQRKLKELYFQLTERNADLLPYQKTLSVATMSFKTDGNGAADTSLANYKRLRTGDIAFEGHTSKEFRYGRFVLNDVGDGIMSPRFSALRPLHEMPINFWKYYIHYEPIMRKVLVNSTKAGTMMNELVINEFLQESILVPSVAEQQAIGRFFKQLDTLITLHQRKLEKLQNIKKSCLEKMFV